MNQEKFVNFYIELLNTTIAEAVNKNIVVMSQKKVLEDDLVICKKIQTDYEEQILELKNRIIEMEKNKELFDIESIELSKSLQHVNTFRNELTKARLIIDDLNKQLKQKNEELEKLSLNKKSSSKKQKVSLDVVVEDQKEDNETPITVKDAGKF